MTNDELRKIGIEALERELGVAGAMRFLLLFSKGESEHTQDHHQWLDQLSMDNALDQLQALPGRGMND